MDRLINLNDEQKEKSHIQMLLWVQELQVAHHDRVGRPDQEDQVVQGSQCHPFLPLCHPL